MFSVKVGGVWFLFLFVYLGWVRCFIFSQVVLFILQECSLILFCVSSVFFFCRAALSFIKKGLLFV